MMRYFGRLGCHDRRAPRKASVGLAADTAASTVLLAELHAMVGAFCSCVNGGHAGRLSFDCRATTEPARGKIRSDHEHGCD
jgi:hypothetical protein